MGDRALIQFEQGPQRSPAIYVHWLGSRVPAILARLELQMEGRSDDLNYVAARCVQVICDMMPDEPQLSVGIWNQRIKLRKSDSQGDAGCFVVDISTVPWTIERFGGYA